MHNLLYFYHFFLFASIYLALQAHVTACFLFFLQCTRRRQGNPQGHRSKCRRLYQPPYQPVPLNQETLPSVEGGLATYSK